MRYIKNIYTKLAHYSLLLLLWTSGAKVSAQQINPTLNTNGAVYSGGGISEGVDEAGSIVGQTDLRSKVLEILKTGLSYMALIAVVVIVIAGIRLVVSLGEDEQKDKARRTITYAIIGLIVILLARGIVEVIASIGT